MDKLAVTSHAVAEQLRAQIIGGKLETGAQNGGGFALSVEIPT